MNDVKITVAGTGYVGLSIATLLAQHNTVTAIDIVPEKVDMINRGESPIVDHEIEHLISRNYQYSPGLAVVVCGIDGVDDVTAAAVVADTAA